MVTDRTRPQPATPTALLLAEVSNESQWIVWPDVEHEAAWVEEELARDQAAVRVFAAHTWRA